MKTVPFAMIFWVICSLCILSCKKSVENTAESNTPPTVPASPAPADAAANVPVSPVLKWACSDPDTGCRMPETLKYFYLC
jgi:hypothetical protein